VTAEYVRILNMTRNQLFAHGQNIAAIDAKIQLYAGQLKRIADSKGYLPQATRKDIYTGFGYRTTLGKRALASTLEYRLSVLRFSVLRYRRSCSRSIS